MSGIDSMTEFYVYENMQLLEQLEEILLSGQSDTGELSQEEIEEIFRAMHTIKGSSAMMGYDSLMNLTHSIEDVFDEIRSGRKLTQSKWEEVIDVVLAIIDFLKDEISKVQEGLFPQASIEELYQRSSNLLKEDIEENISYNTQVDETVDEVVNLDSNGMKIKVFFEDGCGMESIRALGVLMSLEGMHSSIKTVPENLEDDCDGEIAQNGLLLVLENPIDKEAIEKAIQGTMFLKCFEIEEPNENNKEEVAEAEVSEKIEEIEIKEDLNKEETVIEEAITNKEETHVLEVVKEESQTEVKENKIEEKNSLLEEERAEVKKLFEALGIVIELPVHLMGIGGALTGCGPAFIDLIIEALGDAGVKYGVPRKQAYEMVSQMILGSAKLQLETGEHPGVLKDNVCSPAGTTICGVDALEHAGIRAGFIDAIDAIMNK